MDARRIPYRQEFDFVGMFGVLEHIPEDEMVLSQVHSALNTGKGPKCGIRGPRIDLLRFFVDACVVVIENREEKSGMLPSTRRKSLRSIPGRMPSWAWSCVWNA